MQVRRRRGGAEHLVPGNGLRGLRERLDSAAAGWTSTARGEASDLTMTLPAASSVDGIPSWRWRMTRPTAARPRFRPVGADQRVPGRRPDPGAAGHPLAAGAGRRVEVVAEAGDGRQAVEQIPQVKSRRGADGHAHAGDVEPGGAAGDGISRDLAHHHPHHLRRRPAGAGRDQREGPGATCSQDVSLEQLVDAIQAVAGGGSLVQPAVTQRLLSGLEHMRQFRQPRPPGPADRAQTEILRLMAGGFSNKEIANSLGWPRGTIKNHVSISCQARRARSHPGDVLKAFGCNWSGPRRGPGQGGEALAPVPVRWQIARHCGCRDAAEVPGES